MKYLLMCVVPIALLSGACVPNSHEQPLDPKVEQYISQQQGKTSQTSLKIPPLPNALTGDDNTEVLAPTIDKNNDLFCHLIKQEPAPLDSIRYYLKEGLSPNCNCEFTYTNQKFFSRLLVLRKLMQDKYHRYSIMETPLLIAIHKENLPLIQLLLNHQARADAHIGTAGLPINSALLVNNTAIINLLLIKGANGADADLNYAQNEAIINRFLAAGADPSKIDIELALKKGNIPLLRRLMKKGAQPKQVDAFDIVRYHEYETLVILLENGVDPDIKSKRMSETLLSEAIKAEKPKKVKLLLEFGADPNRTRGFGSPPLKLAIKSGNLSVVQLLLEANASTKFASMTARDFAIGQNADSTLISLFP